MKERIILLVFVFLFGAPYNVGAQTQQKNGLYAGTFWVDEERFPVSYFLESLQKVEILQRLTKDSVFMSAFSKTFSAYDAIVITSHPDSISDMKINPSYATFADRMFIEEINRGITESSQIERGCIVLPFGAVSVDGKFLTYSVFVYSDGGRSISDGEFEKCLREAANHSF